MWEKVKETFKKYWGWILAGLTAIGLTLWAILGGNSGDIKTKEDVKIDAETDKEVEQLEKKAEQEAHEDKKDFDKKTQEIIEQGKTAPVQDLADDLVRNAHGGEDE